MLPPLGPMAAPSRGMGESLARRLALCFRSPADSQGAGPQRAMCYLRPQAHRRGSDQCQRRRKHSQSRRPRAARRPGAPQEPGVRWAVAAAQNWGGQRAGRFWELPLPPYATVAARPTRPPRPRARLAPSHPPVVLRLEAEVEEFVVHSEEPQHIFSGEMSSYEVGALLVWRRSGPVAGGIYAAAAC